MEPVTYAVEPHLTPEEFVDVLRRSALAERRPVGDAATVAGMLAHAGVVVTARVGGRLVGVSRAVTDFSYCTYLSDLAVDVAHHGRGVGRELLRRTHDAAGRHTTLILLAAPKAATYYPHVGMRRHDSCWVIDREPRASAGGNHPPGREPAARAVPGPGGVFLSPVGPASRRSGVSEDRRDAGPTDSARRYTESEAALTRQKRRPPPLYRPNRERPPQAIDGLADRANRIAQKR